MQTRTEPAPAAPPPGGSPIYDQLAREWAAEGRTMPGRPDGEWTRLTLFPSPSAEEQRVRPTPPPRRGWLHDRHTAWPQPDPGGRPPTATANGPRPGGPWPGKA
ncbi:hypothetical protein [Streptomyces peucetius]|uniref:Uncharacterized protein n=1 Tax=Streptomyces peucetius TaxID=1950 RepID=A0ABY6IAT3_STRPE|nr:hypothetical protein [Streptomyces peucetius]UYQ64113.1 hypothetical protein OGH68_23365 [Streptomyces peucetius]